jgi:hypothetical protein
VHADRFVVPEALRAELVQPQSKGGQQDQHQDQSRATGGAANHAAILPQPALSGNRGQIGSVAQMGSAAHYRTAFEHECHKWTNLTNCTEIHPKCTCEIRTFVLFVMKLPAHLRQVRCGAGNVFQHVLSNRPRIHSWLRGANYVREKVSGTEVCGGICFLRRGAVN